MSHREKFHARLLGGAAMLSLSALVSVAHAETADYSIPSQPLDQALRAFGVQSGHSTLIDMALVREKKSQSIKMSADPETALRRLLAGTGLSYTRDGDVFAIVVAKNDVPLLRTPMALTKVAAETVSGSAVEGLVVTAQKRRENIQDVPIAISAFSQDKLEISQIAGGPDLMTQVPNMTFTKTNFSSYSIQIRGIGTQAISATTDPAVSVSHNNTSFIRNRFFEQEFYDLERIEVLRGPQGTLYGRNATAGVVNLITAKPSFDYETKGSLDLGNFESRRMEAMANLPLVEDKVALRLAGAWTKRDGYATNALSGDPIDGRDLWSTRLSLRVAPTDSIDVNLIWEHFEESDDRLRSGKQLCKKDVVDHVGDVEITDYFDTSTSGGQSGALWGGVQATLSQGCERNSLYAQNSFQRPNGIMLPYYVPLGAIGLPINPNRRDPYAGSDPNENDPAVISATNDQPQDLRVIESMIDPDYRAKSDITELQVSFDVSDNLTLTSETAYATDTVYSLQDFNRFNSAPGAWAQPNNSLRAGLLEAGPNGGIFCDPQLGCSDRLIAVDISTADSKTFSQEFRLNSNYDGPFNFSLGGNYLRYDTEDKYYVFINSLTMIAANGASTGGTSPYEMGETDNIECMHDGYTPGDPSGVYAVTGCTYIDPNDIAHVNDEGHNYFLSRNPYKLISYAAFGEAYWNITEDLKLTAGLRVTKDKKDAPRIPTWILASNSVGYPVAEVVKQEWTKPTGRLALDWKPDLAFTDDTLLYASYAHGYKAGGANPPGFVRIFYSDRSVAEGQSASSATRPKTFEPEYVDAFELGMKNTLADGAVTLNLAGFYYDYEGYQVSEIVDRSAFNRNFDATVWGLELEADWQVLENFRLGFKGGYENTSIADGEQAIDLMDRTAGDPNWVVVRPFPTYASSCILPTYVFENPDGTIGRVGGVGGGGPGGCELAYSQGFDPVTNAPYGDPPGGMWDNSGSHPGYPGFDPTTAPNGGEGIMKDLSGNELPNAPNYTATLTADYTVPMGNQWTLTFHGDFYYQSESWWRVFNDHEYNKLKDYHTINLAAFLRNEDSGWNIMAYVKNVTDETAITGAFLNSDDTGLTTNVFLTEPRLYGVRINKNWSGLPFWSKGTEGARHEPGTPYLFTLELGGQIQRVDAPNDMLEASFNSAFPAPFDLADDAQDNDLDWGDGRDMKLIVQPDGGPWRFTAAVRYGRTASDARHSAKQLTDPVCAFAGAMEFYCDLFAGDPKYGALAAFSEAESADAFANEREEFNFVDFAVGRDLDIGGFSKSTLSVGLRYAQFTSETNTLLRGTPDWFIPEGFYYYNILDPTLLPSQTTYKSEIGARREFEGEGPFAVWEAAHKLVDMGEAGRVDLDWSVSGGVLFGDQETVLSGAEETYFTEFTPVQLVFSGSAVPPVPVHTVLPVISERRSADGVTVPTAGGSLGLSYNLERVSIGAGYRWERYFDVLDGGYMTANEVDRTVSGPYFKVAIGFGN